MRYSRAIRESLPGSYSKGEVKPMSKTIESIYGDKAKTIRDAITAGHLRIATATVSIAAEKAKATDDVKIPYEKLVILDEVGATVLYGSIEKAYDDMTYAWDLGVRSGLRTDYLSKVVDPDKELRKTAALALKAGLYDSEEEAFTELKAKRDARQAKAAEAASTPVA